MKSPEPAAAEVALKAISDHLGILMNVLIRNLIDVVFL